MRFPEILWGQTLLTGVGIVGVPKLGPNGPTLGAWYSQKASRPVDGFLGPNAFKAFRVEIDYAKRRDLPSERRRSRRRTTWILVGLTLQPQADRSYRVIGVAQKDGKPAVEGVEPGDKLLRIGNLNATGATMGTVVDALRGSPGDVRILLLERNGRPFKNRSQGGTLFIDIPISSPARAVRLSTPALRAGSRPCYPRRRRL